MTALSEADPRWLRTALLLVALTALYNVVEAVIAISSGIAADSIALVGFGLDSIIECAAAAVVLWRLWVEARGADRERVEESEQRVMRFVGVTFILLALYVVGEAGWTLYAAEEPRESIVGIVLAVASLVIMPLIAWGKLRAAREVGSGALRAEAKETLACAWLSAALLVGLVLNAAAGLWWADPVVALIMVPWLVREGLEGIRGEEDEDDD